MLSDFDPLPYLDVAKLIAYRRKPKRLLFTLVRFMQEKENTYQDFKSPKPKHSEVCWGFRLDRFPNRGPEGTKA